MADKDLREGDEVSWNWGGGQPTGKVKELKTSGKLEIESKGKRVHKNADEGNPAVHVEREGNDVVKRASELNRLRGGGENDVVEQKGGGEEQTKQEQAKAAETKKPRARGGRRGARKSAGGAKKAEVGEKEEVAATAKSKKAAAGRRRGKAATKKAVVGEKREREEEGSAEGGEDVDLEKGEKEEEGKKSVSEEKETGKEAKKPRLSPSAEESSQPIGAAPSSAAEVRAVAAELEELKEDNVAYGLDVETTAGEPRRAADMAAAAGEAGVETGEKEEAGPKEAEESSPRAKKRRSTKSTVEGKTR